jgi:hypothetical protein
MCINIIQNIKAVAPILVGGDSRISSYSFGATVLIFCMMFMHIMEVCMSTGF